MTKEDNKIIEEYYDQYNIGPKTIVLVVDYYIDIGERAASQITQEDIDQIYKEKVEKEKKLKTEGKVSLLSPDFIVYLLTACVGLYKMPKSTRYKLIKKYL